MSEPTNKQLYDEDLVKVKGAVTFLNPGETIGYGLQNSSGTGTWYMVQRLAHCCGCSFVGANSFRAAYGHHIGHTKVSEIVHWNQQNVIIVGWVEKKDAPALNAGRHYARLDGGGKDFLMSWGPK